MSLKKLFICFSLLLTGCAPVFYAGTGALTGGCVFGRDKKVSQSVEDTSIDIKIKRKLQNYKGGVFRDVSVTTDGDCVLLTGTVKSNELISEAERVAWSVKNVKIVDNNITLGNQSFAQALKDAYITSTCRTKLIAAQDIKSLNVKIKTENSIVYLSGFARNNKELDNIINIVRKVKDVKKVISYISINDKY